MKKFLKGFIIVNLIFVNTLCLHSQSQLTPFKIIAGGRINGNFHLAGFQQLEAYPSCCTNYDFAFGFGYSFFAGIEYKTQSKLFGFPYSYDLLFSYNNLSARFGIEEKLGNIITGNDYVEAFSEHSLDATINGLILEPGFNLFPLKNLPLNIRLGLKFGILSDMSFVQEERILTPDWITYKETGTKIKYHYEGILPNASKIYSAITLGFRYDAFKFANFTISPIINFDYGITNVTSDLNWKISSLQAGLSIAYNVPKANDIPPLEAPMPALPPLPEPKKMTLNLNILADGKELKENDTLTFTIKEKRFINRYILLPIVFFKVNTDEMLVSDDQSRSEEEAQKNAYVSAINYLNEKPNVKLTLYSSSLNTEESRMVKERLNKLISLIKSVDISDDRIQTKEVVIDASKLSRNELEQDNCFIRFDFSDGTEIIPYRSDTLSKLIVEPIEISIESKIDSEIELSKFSGELMVNDKILKRFDKAKLNVELKPEIVDFEAGKVEVKSKAIDVFGNTVTGTFKYNLKSYIEIDKVFENVISDFEESNYVRQFTLGYCEFDKAEFSYVNKLAVEQIKQAVIAGELVEIIPLFDFMGSEEHNLKLANARANSAISLLGMKPDEVKINIPKDYFFSNENPYGRMMNRTVIVRIKNISGN